MYTGYTSSSKQIAFDDYTYSTAVSDIGCDSKGPYLIVILGCLCGIDKYSIPSILRWLRKVCLSVSCVKSTQKFGVVYWLLYRRLFITKALRLG
jgi:hypothetical protein